jgi:hypothetical protein
LQSSTRSFFGRTCLNDLSVLLVFRWISWNWMNCVITGVARVSSFPVFAEEKCPLWTRVVFSSAMAKMLSSSPGILAGFSARS